MNKEKTSKTQIFAHLKMVHSLHYIIEYITYLNVVLMFLVFYLSASFVQGLLPVQFKWQTRTYLPLEFAGD